MKKKELRTLMFCRRKKEEIKEKEIRNVRSKGN
jgi:hypothetical protein